MNCKYPNIKTFRKVFYEKFPNSDLILLDFLENRRVRVQNKYGTCLCDIDSLLWYGTTTIRCAENKTDYFINKANQTHNYKYDYSLVRYFNTFSKIIIICPIHGKFEQLPNSHLQGNECSKCGTIKTSSKTKKREEDYINEINLIHNGKYSIELNSYKNNNIKLFHYCKVHNSNHLMRPSHVLEGMMPCKKCKGEKIAEQARKNSIGWSYTKWEEKGKISKCFDSFKVYIIKCWNEDEEFYKIGKTFQSITRRLQSKKEMPYSWEIIKEFKGESKEISELETIMKKTNKINRYTPNIKFNGMYECFKEIKYENIFVK